MLSPALWSQVLSYLPWEEVRSLRSIPLVAASLHDDVKRIFDEIFPGYLLKSQFRSKMDRAVQVINREDIPSSLQDHYTKMSEILSGLISQGSHGAIPLSHVFPEDQHDYGYLVEALCNDQHWDPVGAEYAARCISDPEEKSRSFYSISNAWLQRNNFQESQRTALCISDETMRFDMLGDIAQALLEKDLEAALNVIKLISDSQYQSHIMRIVVISSLLTEDIWNPIGAERIARNDIPDLEEQGEALIDISEALARRYIPDLSDSLKNLEEAKRIAWSILHPHRKCESLMHIVSTLLEDEHWDPHLAAITAYSILDVSIQSHSLQKISEVLIEERHWNPALAEIAAGFIPDQEIKNNTIEKIVIALLERGHFSEAARIAREMLRGDVRDICLLHIRKLESLARISQLLGQCIQQRLDRTDHLD